MHPAAHAVDALDLAIGLAEAEAPATGPAGAGVVATGSIAVAAEVRVLSGPAV